MGLEGNRKLTHSGMTADPRYPQKVTISEMTVNFSNVGIIGAGAMGRGIAQIAAQAGSDVLLLDSFEGAAERGRDAILAQWQKLHEKGKLDAAQRDALSARDPCRRLDAGACRMRPGDRGRGRGSRSQTPAFSRTRRRRRAVRHAGHQHLFALGHRHRGGPGASGAHRGLSFLQSGSADEGGRGRGGLQDRGRALPQARRLCDSRWATARCRRKTRPASSSTMRAAATAPKRCASSAKA